MDDALFESQKTRVDVEALAGQLGLDVPRFKACLGAPETAQRLAADIAAALQAGVKATPSFVVRGLTYSGEFPLAALPPPPPVAPPQAPAP
jgi:protein-disulfide isomerase